MFLLLLYFEFFRFTTAGLANFDQFFSFKFGYGESFTDSAVQSLAFEQATTLFAVVNQENVDNLFWCIRS